MFYTKSEDEKNFGLKASLPPRIFVNTHFELFIAEKLNLQSKCFLDRFPNFNMLNQQHVSCMISTKFVILNQL